MLELNKEIVDVERVSDAMQAISLKYSACFSVVYTHKTIHTDTDYVQGVSEKYCPKQRIKNIFLHLYLLDIS